MKKISSRSNERARGEKNKSVGCVFQYRRESSSIVCSGWKPEITRALNIFFISDDIEAQLRTHKFSLKDWGVCENNYYFPKYFLSPYHNKKHFSGLLSFARHSTRRDPIGRQHIARATNTFANKQHKTLRYLEEWPADDAFYWLWNFNYFPPNNFVHVSAICFSQPGFAWTVSRDRTCELVTSREMTWA